MYNEIRGYGCFRRVGNTGYMRFKWDAMGKVMGTVFYYQIYDCTTRKVVASWNLSYQNSSPKNYGVAVNRSTNLSRSHKYAGQITGGGTYRRPWTGNYEGLAGHFIGGAVNAGVPKWFDRTTNCY